MRQTKPFHAKDVAHRTGMKEKQVRRYFRRMPRLNHEKYKRFEFSPEEFESIADEIASRRKNYRITVTSKGQLVIPAAIRQRYHIRRGTQIDVEEVAGGILLRTITDESIEHAHGILADKGLSESLEKEPDREIR